MKRNLGIFISLALIAIGIVGAVNIILHGEDVMGTTNKVPWGILISGYEYFVGISTGLLLVAALGYVFNFAPIKVIGKTLVMVSVFTMFSAFAILLVELGNPINMYHYFITPNLMSPIWWMAPLYSTYLVLLLVLLYNIFTRNEQKIKLFASITAVVAVISLINIGFLFGFLNARAYWNGPFSPIYFVITAFFSGIAFAAILAFFQGKKEELSPKTQEAIRNFYLGSIIVVMMLITVKILTGLYGAVSAKSDAILSFLSGPLSFNFWVLEVVIGLFIPLVILLVTRSSFTMAIAGAMSLLGLLFMRINMVIAGQIVELKIVYGGAKETVLHSYFSLWSEWSLIIGAFGITLFLYFFKGKLEKTVNQIVTNKKAA